MSVCFESAILIFVVVVDTLPILFSDVITTQITTTTSNSVAEIATISSVCFLPMTRFVF